jgi:hypothetical protein
MTPTAGSALSGWFHWVNDPSRPFVPGNVHTDLWPDLREYDPLDLSPTGLGPLRDGTPSRVFSSDREGVVDLHFRWMRAYGIDGAELQRFVVALTTTDPRVLPTTNSVAQRVKRAAEKYGRSFYVNYDISGASGDFTAAIMRDWEQRQADLVASPAYARQAGKPVVGVWGFGLTDRAGTPAQAIALIQWLKSRGAYVIGGVPFFWRTGRADSQSGYADVYRQFDMIRPWAVGRFASTAEADAQLAQTLFPDKAYCDANGIDYGVVLWPGFSWANMGNGSRNSIPRAGGRFLWGQARNALQLPGAPLFIAMFDELDEGTAVMKAAEDSTMIPRDTWFLTLDADGERLSSDFYLRLVGEIGRLKRGDRLWTPTVPILPF